MLLDAFGSWNSCDKCSSAKLIYGYRSFESETTIKIEVECEDCKSIYFKYVNGKEYEEVRKKDKGMDKEEGAGTTK